MTDDANTGAPASGVDERLAAILQEPRGARSQALDRACSEAPELADDLRRRLRLLETLGLDGAAADGPVARPGGAEGPRRFGDFELFEPLGVGGMGVVHRARQVSLDREVVVKLVRPDQLNFAGVRERFRREAEAVARLQHPGIVPIHAVGEHAGVPFFAMEAVDGRGLDEVLEDVAGRAPEGLDGADLAPGLAGRSWPEACLAVASEVAAALAHAHGRGIVHRDVKPSNVLVTSEGRARLIDFGLHALTESQGADDRLTRAGAAVGTLLYMAPEQLEGAAGDARSDVYSLGAALYELLSLQPPFRGADRSATERMIRAGSPDALRPRNRAVKPDVEAVVLRAMAVDPARRYTSADALRQDLERALEGRPVVARPDGVAYRVRRWATRQPALAATACVALLLAVAAPTIIIVQQGRHARRVERSLEDERLARRSAEDLTTFVVDLLDAGDPNLGDPDPGVAAFLERSAERLEDRLGEDPARRAVVASVLGRIQGNLGAWREGAELLGSAIEAFEAELERLDELAAPSDVRRVVRGDLAEARARLAGLLETRDAVVPALRQRLALADDLAELDGPDSWRAIQARADAMRLGARVPAGALEGHEPPSTEEVLATLRDAVAVVSTAPGADAHERARAHGWLGAHLANRAQLARGAVRAQWFREAGAQLEASLAAYAEAGLEGTIERADALQTLGVVLRFRGDLDGAEQRYREALEVYEARLPSDHYKLGGAWVNLGGLTLARGRPGDAAESMRRGHEVLARALGAENANTVRTEASWLGALYLAGQHDGLAERYASLVERQERVLGEEDPALRTSWERRALLLRAEGDEQGALAALDRALELTEAQLGAEHAEAGRLRAVRGGR